jgi:hypothetical protein
VGNATSSLIQIIGSNVSVNGIKDTVMTAKNTARDFRIPMSDLFGVGNAQWNTNVYGDCRVHLEIEPNRLKIAQLGGAESVSVFDSTGVNLTFGAMLDFTVASGLGQLAIGAGVGTTVPLTTKLTYKDFGLDVPFYVGQAITVEYVEGGNPAANESVIIEAIEYNEGTNATNPPAGSEKVRIWTRTAVYTNATGAAQDITAVLVNAVLSDTTKDQIRINRAEIVLSEMVGQEGPAEVDYTSYSTEEVQGNGIASFNKQIIAEPNAQNIIIAHCNSGETAPERAWTSYRMAINNNDVTGNRDIDYNRPIHIDRIERTFNNMGENISNISLDMVKTNVTVQQNDTNQAPMYPILETLPLQPQSKLVNLELNSAGAQDVIFFKQLVKSI